MKEAIVQKDLLVQIVDSPIPTPNANQVLIKVVVSGCNPKDWYAQSQPMISPRLTNDPNRKLPVMSRAANSGDDIAGVVHAVGENVVEFKPGDRVAAFHEMGTPGGSFAEYAVAPEHTTFHLPASTSFEQAATLPLAAMTAAVGLFQRLGLPAPWTPAAANPKGEKRPLLVYGAATAVGAFAIQLATLSGIHPIIGVAGRGIPFAESLIDKARGDAIVDYRDGDAATVAGIKSALRAAGCGDDVPLRHCFDAVSEKSSPANCCAVLDHEGGQVAYVLGSSYEKLAEAEGLKCGYTMVGSVHRDEKDFGFVWFRYFSRLLAEGRLKAHPIQKRGGLEGVSEALKDLQAGKASAVKYVFEISNSA
jgi:NADPH:quinone reductase-like Zn-dependent oxidoreductase